MANVKGRVTLDEIDILEVDGDPSVTPGVAAPISSIALLKDTKGAWQKRSASNTDWKNLFSVADDIPFDPAILSGVPGDKGYNFRFDPASGLWKQSAEMSFHQLAPFLTPTATTLNGTLTLTNTSNGCQVLTGTAAGYSIALPNATTLTNGWKFELYNTTNQTIDVKDGSGATLFTLAQGSVAPIILQSNSTQAGVWISWQILSSSIASGIINYKVTGNVPFTTSSSSDVVITNMSVLPQAGTYAAWFSGNITIVKNNDLSYASFYKAGVKVGDSERANQGSSSNFQTQSNTLTIISVNGSQTVDVRVRISTDTLTVTGRTMTFIRLGT